MATGLDLFAGITGPSIEVSSQPSVPVGHGTTFIDIMLSDTSGITGYSIFLNGKDYTLKAEMIDRQESRQKLHLSLNAPLRSGLNTLVIRATNQQDRSSSRTIILKKEESPSAAKKNLLRRFLTQVLKQLF